MCDVVYARARAQDGRDERIHENGTETDSWFELGGKLQPVCRSGVRFHNFFTLNNLEMENDEL